MIHVPILHGGGVLPVRRGAGEAGSIRCAGEAGSTRCAGEAGSTRCAGASVPNVGQSFQPRPNPTGLWFVDQSSAWLIRMRRHADCIAQALPHRTE